MRWLGHIAIYSVLRGAVSGQSSVDEWDTVGQYTGREAYDLLTRGGFGRACDGA
jgi:hypothetical protein